jgi:penicillin amidase
MRRRTALALACALTACETPRTATDAAADAPRADVSARDAAVADVAADVPADVAASPPAPLPVVARCGAVAEDRAPGFAGPSAEVEVLRDNYGIPHIYGRTDRDVFFASGYTQAVDRLFQMELLRRSARGTLAEVVGRERLEQDRLVRVMGVSFWGRLSAERVRAERPDIDALIDAWTAGVNRRVREVTSGAAPLPAGFRASELNFQPAPWAVEDAYRVGRLILFRNANQLDYDVLWSLVRRYAPDAASLPITQSVSGAFVLPPEERPRPGAMARRLPRDAGRRLARWLNDFSELRRGASNNWAVAARHSANGRPLIAGDPHQPLQSPGVFWAQHMNSADAGGGFDVAGFSFVGAPGVQLGHNRRVAWTATTAYPDTMDLWAVDVDEASVSLGGRALPLRRCEETIAVRDAEAVRVPVEEVPGYGVLVPPSLFPLPVTASGQRVLFAWAGFRPTIEAAVFFDFDRAADVGAFDDAVRRMEIGAFNFIAADARDIAYRSRVLVPDRGDPRTMVPSYEVMDGAQARSVWTGALLAESRHPSSRGGARGYLFSANNDPFGFTLNHRVDDDPFYYGVWFDPGTRAGRIDAELARLTAAGRVTVEQLQALQRDTHSAIADEFIPPLVEAWSRRGTDPALARYRDDAELGALVDALSRWDRQMARDASEPVVFEGFAAFLSKQVLGDELGTFFGAIHTREPIYPLKLTAQVIHQRFPEAAGFMREGRDVLLLRALDETRGWLRARFGGVTADRYRWRDLHRTRFAPLYPGGTFFDGGTELTSGSVGTVNVSQAPFFDAAGTPQMFHESRSGALYRMVTSFDEDGTPRATINFPRGNVGEPGGPFWTNADADWLAGTYRPLRFRRADIDADLRERTVLRP